MVTEAQREPWQPQSKPSLVTGTQPARLEVRVKSRGIHGGWQYATDCSFTIDMCQLCTLGVHF